MSRVAARPWPEGVTGLPGCSPPSAIGPGFVLGNITGWGQRLRACAARRARSAVPLPGSIFQAVGWLAGIWLSGYFFRAITEAWQAPLQPVPDYVYHQVS
jgi:hypothetical protein